MIIKMIRKLLISQRLVNKSSREEMAVLQKEATCNGYFFKTESRKT
jgi:hypothetical protein